ncbi:MAG: 5-formyltetrahydrofolate cyclo-ligase [Clostridiales bacterium]|nr:5-formyltetrahydrofolate cyclo-ligase [Clostridiales bacterium]
MDKREEKQRLRRCIRTRIQALSPYYCRRADQAILSRVKELSLYKNASLIFCFVGTAGEIQTISLIGEALAEGKRVCVPRCISRGIMEICEIRELAELKPGAYGILEPGEGCGRVEAEEVGLAILPCLSCTRDGRRLGQGGGYYDRYLKEHEKELSGRCVLVCREALMLEEIPVEDHDRRADLVVWENGQAGGENFS